MMVHHGVEILTHSDDFTKQITSKYFDFLPQPLYWTYAAGATQCVASVMLALGIYGRVASLGLLTTMVFAGIYYYKENPAILIPHQNYTNLYMFEAAGIYGAVFFYFTLAGPGKLSFYCFRLRCDCNKPAEKDADSVSGP
jgi:uncharacterized membrane protein YphA (DoxX/SURF4 family)